MPRNPVDKCNVPWGTRYGTASGVEGNLPSHRIHKCVENEIDINAINSVFPWVRSTDFSFYHIKCPYSIESDFNYVRNLNKTSNDYWKANVAVSTASHTATAGMMIRYSRGSKHGWLCVDPNCPYYIDNGKPYFYL